MNRKHLIAVGLLSLSVSSFSATSTPTSTPTRTVTPTRTTTSTFTPTPQYPLKVVITRVTSQQILLGLTPDARGETGLVYSPLRQQVLLGPKISSDGVAIVHNKSDRAALVAAGFIDITVTSSPTFTFTPTFSFTPTFTVSATSTP